MPSKKTHVILISVMLALLCGCSNTGIKTPNISIEVDTSYLDPDSKGTGVYETENPAEEALDELTYPEGYSEEITLDPSWEFAANSEINNGHAVLYRASRNRKDKVVGVNAGHGTKGGMNVKTYCHPDGSAKVTGGSTPAGSIKAAAVSQGMTFNDGAKEAAVTLITAVFLKDMLLSEGYDVLMLRDEEDVQLDNIARTVIANNTADCIVSLHWDGDGTRSDKGCFYISTPEKIKSMYPVSEHWKEHERLGQSLIEGLKECECRIYDKGYMPIDLTQTSYSTIPSIDIELGNQTSKHDDESLTVIARGLMSGIDMFFENTH